jgi:hypothetical protein
MSGVPLTLLGRSALVAGRPRLAQAPADLDGASTGVPGDLNAASVGAGAGLEAGGPDASKPRQLVRMLGSELDTAPVQMARWSRLDHYGRAIVAAVAGALATRERQPRDLTCGLYAASAYSCFETNAAFHRGFLEKGARLASPLLFPYTLPGAAASEAAQRFGLTGEYLVFPGGPATALASVLAAADSLSEAPDGSLVVVAADVLEPVTLATRTAHEALEPSVTLSEGACALWLRHGSQSGVGLRFAIEGALGGAPDGRTYAPLIREALQRADLPASALTRVLTATVRSVWREQEITAASMLAPGLVVHQLCFALGDAGAALGLLTALAALEEPGPCLVLASERGASVAVVIDLAR